MFSGIAGNPALLNALQQSFINQTTAMTHMPYPIDSKYSKQDRHLSNMPNIEHWANITISFGLNTLLVNMYFIKPVLLFKVKFLMMYVRWINKQFKQS